ncbi:MAG: Spo0B domain-containing protein [Clostridia bacterium]|nr:Spo0B domain-containing protein [Clostridia bacterium]
MRGKEARRLRRQVDVDKTTRLAIAFNGLQIGLMVFLLLYLVFTRTVWTALHLLAVIAALVVGTGAALDIRDAVNTRTILGDMDDMDATILDMEELNNTLRAQRHDFLNHLQVVYSLMEMEEYQEAGSYMEKIYGDITALGRVLKTANPAINALLQVKLAACEKAGIRVDLQIQSSWKDLPVPGWEMCKVLSNLLDNAMDALEETEDKRLTICLTEDLRRFRFSVKNTGPTIPLRSQQAIFQPGVTGKGEGHGMGLYIVRRTLEEHGGEIGVRSEMGETEFFGSVPKEVISEKRE